MKNILVICFCLLLGQSHGQQKTVEIDYIVDYAIPSNRNQTIDTISIGFNKEGKYLWTNYNALALSLAKSMIKNTSEDYSNAKSNIIYDAEEGTLLLTFEFNKNIIFFNLNLDSFFPYTGSSENDERFNLITEDVGETIELLGKDVKVYNMYPSDKPNDVLTIATDQDFEVNNNLIFKKIFELMFQKLGSKKEEMPEVPNGLIMKVIEKEKTMIEAIKVDNTKKTININYSFKITE